MKASHALHVELVTRISTQRLHYRAGDEEMAAASLHSLFQKTRGLMVDHPEEREFQEAALVLLNHILRPYTARWHGWMLEDDDKLDASGNPVMKLRDECMRRKFREELRELQPLLHGARLTFAALAEQRIPEKAWLNPAKDSPAYQALAAQIHAGNPQIRAGASLPSILRPQVPLCAAGKDGKRPECEVGCDMLAAEQAHIIARRKAMAPHDSALLDGKGVENAFGLAISGGGIRSATFCLGVVQQLHRRGLFRQVDYLSTVSGGGYLGTFLTSYLGHAENSGAVHASADPDARIEQVFGPGLNDPVAGGQAATAEPPPLRHLRNSSKYLIHGGRFAVIHILALFLNGVLATFLMLISLPLILAWVARISKAVAPSLPDLSNLTKWLPNVLTKQAIFHQPGGAVLALLLLLTLCFVALRPVAQRLAEGKPWTSGWVKTRRFIEYAGNISGIATLLMALFCASYLWVGSYDTLSDHLANISLGKNIPAPQEWMIAAIAALIPTLLGWFSKRKDGSTRRWATILFFLTGPIFFLITFTVIASHLGVGAKGDDLRVWALVSLALLAWIFLALNINTISLHHYYRDRLCECYLAVPQSTEVGLIERGLSSFLHGSCPDRNHSSSQVGTVKSSPLSTAGRSVAAPYHLINAVLNASASRNPELRGRNGDFFLFSRAYCGSPLTGYLPTRRMEEANPGIDLGTAMAISGAAVSTNMGSTTRPERRFLMALFNIRLGYWMRRPGLGEKKDGAFKNLASRLFSGPGPLYFFREMTGILHERTRYINLSDGGHIENLAAYELLRRQCKFIVCVDAGMEPGMECTDLMRLQRLAEIDFGIRMHFDPTELSLLPTRYSRAYGVLVKIDYAPELATAGREVSNKLGWMLYLKLAVTGAEPRHVLDYRRQNPAFPHQTTNDQFYDEAQFESYRSLGQCAARSLFREEIIGRENLGKELEVADWFGLLAGSLLPDNDEALEWSAGVQGCPAPAASHGDAPGNPLPDQLGNG